MESLSDQSAPVRPADSDSGEDCRWRKELSDAIRDPKTLCQHLGLPSDLASDAAARDFSLIAPLPFVRRMRQGDPKDPLLRQVLPALAETESTTLPHDAVGDLQANPAPGLIHKYEGRVLLIAAGDCAINCRYCFRRHFPYNDSPRSEAAWEEAIAAIEADQSIREVILSGGDPLINNDRRLARSISRLERLEHLTTLRIHTRLPIVIPSRVTEHLVRTLKATHLKPVIVLHSNHANEIDQQVAGAVERLSQAGGLLLNQSVLLRHVNDSAEALIALSRRLVEVGVSPYYLHQLDRVAGVEHFGVPIEKGRQLIEQLRNSLPGYAVPRYVQEQPGFPSKTVLA